MNAQKVLTIAAVAVALLLLFVSCVMNGASLYFATQHPHTVRSALQEWRPHILRPRDEEKDDCDCDCCKCPPSRQGALGEKQ